MAEAGWKQEYKVIGDFIAANPGIVIGKRIVGVCAIPPVVFIVFVKLVAIRLI